MKRPSAHSLVEDMGLRLERTARLRPLDVLLVLALMISGTAWLGLSLLGVGPDVLAALGSPAGRLLAAAVGVASVAAVVRAFVVLRGPVTDNDRSLL